MLRKAEQTIQKFNMLSCNDRIVVAVSGGCDSVALLYLLNRLKKKWHLYLHIAHLNHMLRKDESEADSIFVQKLAERLNLPVTCRNLKVADCAEEARLSLEEAARKVRYGFLLQVANENAANKIALGHNRDDQVETVLMRFLRGSGISGLCGIPATRKINGCLVIRPLLEVGRRQIIQFLAARNISFCSDSSNFENVYFRNRIRNQLLPILEENYNPNIREMLVNFAENVAHDFDFLEKFAYKRLKSVEFSSANNGVLINLKKFLGLHKALQKLIVRLAVKQLKGDVRRIDYRHWKEIEDLVANRPKGSIVDLPGEVSAVKNKKGELVLYKRDRKV